MFSRSTDMRKKSLFPDENAILVIAQTKQAEADALPQGPENANCKKRRTATGS
jgi:hypothetical protein